MVETEVELNRAYRALADTTRRLIIEELAARDRQSVFEICTRLATRHGVTYSRQAFSRHLASLEAAGMLEIEWKGTTKLHSLNRSRLSALAGGWISQFKEQR